MFKGTSFAVMSKLYITRDLLPNNQILQVLQENLFEDLNDIKL